jgi:hypothetical protein
VNAVTAAKEPAPRQREEQETDACPEGPTAPGNAWRIYPHSMVIPKSLRTTQPSHPALRHPASN